MRSANDLPASFGAFEDDVLVLLLTMIGERNWGDRLASRRDSIVVANIIQFVAINKGLPLIIAMVNWVVSSSPSLEIKGSDVHRRPILSLLLWEDCRIGALLPGFTGCLAGRLNGLRMAPASFLVTGSHVYFSIADGEDLFCRNVKVTCQVC